LSLVKDYALLFPGQGSQSLGMMDSFIEDMTIKNVFLQASEIIGVDLLNMLQDETPDRINRTENTQTIMLTSAYALYKSWLSKQPDIKLPSYLAGHSLGEYTALVAAEVLNFTDALKLVQCRARLMQQVGDKYDGLMSAILGLSSEKVAQLCYQATDGDALVNCANFNTQVQTVVSGTRSAVMKVNELAKDIGAKAILLPVSVPSHCDLMRDITAEFSKECTKFNFNDAIIPIVNNVTAEANVSGELFKKLLIQQLYMPVQWVKSMEYIASNHINVFIESGPGKVLTGLNRKILPDVSNLLLTEV
jgi:[acyl-carrier-protein] S-malonyltransferase